MFRAIFWIFFCLNECVSLMGPKKRKRSPSGYHGTTNNRRLTKKRTFHGNRHKTREEAEAGPSSASGKKLETNVEATIDKTRGCRIIEFQTFVSFICENVKCKTCDGDITLSESCKAELDFKVQLNCGNCCEKYCHSSPLISEHAYEKNRNKIILKIMEEMDIKPGLEAINICKKEVERSLVVRPAPKLPVKISENGD